MSESYNQDVFCGYLAQGKLRAAMDYLSRFPQHSARYEQYLLRFEKGLPAPCGVLDEKLNALLFVYQQYYREAFYLEIPPAAAEKALKERIDGLLGADESSDQSFEERVAEAFREKGLFFQGGRTAGYLGPYIWKTMEVKTYEVELPEGQREYAVRLLDGFISRSWLEFISFGEVTPGGWTDGDGIICCIRDSYDFDSEAFRVSLLKHEAQHVLDLERYPGITAAELEYRAKLAELIDSSQRNLLPAFLAEADAASERSGHALAAARIVSEIGSALNLSGADLEDASIERIQAAARALFEKSCVELQSKYAPNT